MNKKNEWKQGWPTVLSGAIGMGTGLGLYSMTNSVFVVPLQNEFGWERGQMAFSHILGLAGLVFLPFLGALVDKYDPRKVACVSMVLLSLSFVGMSQLTDSILLYYAVTLFMTFGGLATGPLVFSKVVNTWFHSSRGLALGLTMSGITLTGMLALPLFAHVIETWGWRWAFICFAMIPLLIGLPVVATSLKPAPRGYLSDITDNTTGVDLQEGAIPMKQVLLGGKFWLLAASLISANLAIGGMLHQMQPLFIGQGFSIGEAATLGIVFFVSVAVGRLSSGLLLDRFWPAAVAAGYLLLPLVGVAIFLSEAPAVFWVGVPAALFMGLAQGAEVDFLAYLVPRYFGLGNYGKVFGILLVLLASSMASGGFIFGALFDYFGNYKAALMFAAFAFVCSALLMLISGVIGRDFDHSWDYTAGNAR